MGLGGLQPRVELLLNEAELLDLLTAVEAMSAGAPLRLHESVALFPVADGRGRDTEHALDCANAVDGRVRSRQGDMQLISSQSAVNGRH